MKRTILALTLAALAPSAWAGVVDCAALTPTQRTQAEAMGACSPGAPKSVCLPATDAGIAALVTWLSTQASYQGVVPCSAVRVAADGILIEAGPGDGTCTAELVGTTVANPQPRAQVALRWWRLTINRDITSQEAAAAAEAERQRVEAEADEALPEEP